MLSAQTEASDIRWPPRMSRTARAASGVSRRSAMSATIRWPRSYQKVADGGGPSATASAVARSARGSIIGAMVLSWRSADASVQAGRGGLPTGVERMPRLVDVDQERRMVRRNRLAFTGLAIDLGADDAIGHRTRHQQVIDPHAEVPMEGAGAVIPPGVAAGFRMLEAISIHQAPAAQPEERFPLGRRHVRSAMASPRVPHVLVLGEIGRASCRERV